MAMRDDWCVHQRERVSIAKLCAVHAATHSTGAAYKPPSSCPLGTVDAAQRLVVTKVPTLDHRHFNVVRPKHVHAFELLP
jgi:hypothetical protein